MKSALRIVLNLMVILSLPMLILTGLAAAKVVSPLIVISGSMEPTISVGSLILSTNVKASDLHAGDVASFEREDGVLVTHRVTSNEAVPGSEELRAVKMKGDANNAEDQHPYIQAKALKPLFVVPALGSALAAVGNHKYEILAVISFATGIYLIVKMIRGMKSDRPLKGRRKAEPVKKDKGVLTNQT